MKTIVHFCTSRHPLEHDTTIFYIKSREKYFHLDLIIEIICLIFSYIVFVYIKITSFTLLGCDAVPVDVEIFLTPGLPKFSIIGMPSSVIKESKERVIGSLQFCKKKIPSGGITINLSPADIPKRGAQFDLPIALGILLVSQQIGCIWDLSSTLIAGQLTLQGDILSVQGIFAAFVLCKEKNIQTLLYPQSNRNENFFLPQTVCVEANHLSQATQFFQSPPSSISCLPKSKGNFFGYTESPSEKSSLDFSDIFGNEIAKKVIQISLLAKLNFLFIGSPGCGKTMLIMRAKDLMSKLNYEESLQVTRIYMSHPGFQKKGFVKQSPFRVVHNSCSEASLLGGGAFYPYPGEISLAHKGVLFLDELCEFPKKIIQLLRVPLERKQMRISRVHFSCVFPCDFTLMAATNPCPCGYYGDLQKVCMCTTSAMQRYFGKISGPFLDRIHMIILIRRPSQEDLFKKSPLTTSVLLDQLQESRIRLSKQVGYFSEENILHTINSVSFIKKIIFDAHEKRIISLRRMNAIIKVAMASALLENVTLSEEHVFTAIQMCRIPYQEW